MKVSSNVKEVVFKPITLEIVIESEEEARALSAIFNYAPNTDLLDPSIAYTIGKHIGEKYRILGEKGIIARGITYEQFYRGKKDK